MKVLITILIIHCFGDIINLGTVITETSNKKHHIKVVIEGVQSKKGKIVLAVFNDHEGFKARKPIKRIELTKAELKGNEIQLSLEEGIYGISVFDDENSINKMDYNFLGIPKEGFGFSNYYHKGLSQPKFDNFKFETKNGVVQQIKIRLRYM